MNQSDDRFDHRIDDELRTIAMSEFEKHERNVSGAETEAALAAVRARISDGSVMSLSPARERSGRRSMSVLLGAAAAVTALIVGGLVVMLGRDDDATIVTNTVPAPSIEQRPEPTVLASPTTVNAVPATTDATATAGIPVTTATTGAAPTDTTIAPRVVQTIGVDAADPPPLVEPDPFASISNAGFPQDGPPTVGIGDDVVVVNDADRSTITVVPYGAGVDSSQTRQVTLDEKRSGLTVGPGQVLYGIGDPVLEDGVAMPTAFRFVATPLAGDLAGETVAEEEIGVNEYLELPPYPFGHGPEGIIDRVRNVNATLIGYVDEQGAPIEWPAAAPPLLEHDVRSGVVSVAGSELAWDLDITEAPTSTDTFSGPSAPAPTTGGRVIYTERIGADTTPDADFGPNAMPVVAILEPDGSGRWVRLPDDWSVVASDVWGTVLARTDADSVDLAFLDDARPEQPSATGDPDPVEPSTTTNPGAATNAELAVPYACAAEFNCTQLANTEHGRIVAYDPVADALRLYDGSGQLQQGEVALTEPIADRAPTLEHIGPDDVVYLTVDTQGVSDPVRDLVAIPMAGPRAGTVIRSWTGLDGSDSDLVARKDGLRPVGCCGPLVPGRPPTRRCTSSSTAMVSRPRRPPRRSASISAMSATTSPASARTASRRSSTCRPSPLRHAACRQPSQQTTVVR